MNPGRRTAHLPTTKNGLPKTIPLSPKTIQLLKDLPRSACGRVVPTTTDALNKAFVCGFDATRIFRPPTSGHPFNVHSDTRGVCRQFVVLCQQLGMFGKNLADIDDSKFQAVNNRDRNATRAKLKRRMEEIVSTINYELAALGAADQQEPTAFEPSAGRREEEIAKAQFK